jgi:phosphohistidine phosphatase
MSRFFLLRHARASWPQPGNKDFDRQLTDGGRENAARLGTAMVKSGFYPDAILCSPACRAVETWDEISPNFPGVPLTQSKALYDGDANSYLSLIRAAGEASNLLVIGHNPMLEDLALALSVNHDRKSRENLLTGFPTCGLAVFDVDGSLRDAGSDTTRLSNFVTPQMA